MRLTNGQLRLSSSVPQGLRRTGRRAFARRASAKGMTLIEMLVAVSVMAVMIMGFGQILSQAQRLVVTTQAVLQANNVARGIEQTVRNDIRRLSTSGFLFIDGTHMVFTTAGMNHSISGNAKGTGSVISYGLCTNSAAGATGQILYRQGWVLDGNASSTGSDKWQLDLRELQILSEAELAAKKDEAVAAAPASLTVPPETVTNISALWQMLATNCSSLQIQYATVSGTTITWSNTATTWTFHDQTNWPDAIKVRFRITDSSLPEAFQNIDYEVICLLGE